MQTEDCFHLLLDAEVGRACPVTEESMRADVSQGKAERASDQGKILKITLVYFLSSF